MKFNSAVCFVLTGLALFTLNFRAQLRPIANFLSLVVLVIAGITLVQFLTGLNLGIDTLFFQSSIQDPGELFPHRMAFTSAISFAAASLIILKYGSEEFEKITIYLLIPLLALISFSGMLGYLFREPFLYRFVFIGSMALHTSVLFFALSVSFSLLYPDRGIMSAFLGNRFGNLVARKMFPPVLITSILLAYIRLQAARYHVVSEEFGISVFTIAFLIVSLFVIARIGKQVNKIDEQRTIAENKLIHIHETLNRQYSEATWHLKESEEKFKKLFELSPAGIAISDPSSGIILEANDSFVSPLGIAREEVAGKTVSELGLVPAHLKDVYMEKLYSQGYLHNYETEMTNQAGEKKHMIISVEFIEISGQKRALTLLYDITKRKEMEEELLTAKKLAEESAIAKEKFLSNMSHEIRTPLNAIIGFTSIIESTELSSKQEEYLKIVKSSGNNLLNIINDILDYSKLEAGMLRLEKIPFNLHDLIGSIELMFSEKARESGLMLQVQIAPGVPECVEGDPTRLNQILTNLLSNAFKFTSRGVIRLLVSRGAESGRVQFVVQDTGVGIPPNRQDEIFNRFVQASEDTSRLYGGTGLGLSIVKNLVDLQNGKIELMSEPGIGTTFTVTLPYRQVAGGKREKTPEAEDSEVVPFEVAPFILVAEDNRLNQALARRVLTSMGCNVDIAENGGIAVEMAGKKEYDIVLMDIQMPVFDGYTAARKIRDDLGKDIPIVALTAHVMAGERERCLNAGMNDYISKPYTKEILFRTLKQYLAA